jgi:hypothetical protein
MFLAALALATPSLPRFTSAQATRQPEVVVKTITDALGLKPSTSAAPETLDLGATITCSLIDPAKLAKHSIRGLHEGARVTITRITSDRIHVEADEMEPMPVSGKVTLKMNSDGTFTPVPDAQRGKPPAI